MTKRTGRCGSCGYSAAGLDSFTCPECGSDLREAGIVIDERDHQPPWFKRHAPLWGWLIAWSTGVWFVAFFAIALLPQSLTPAPMFVVLIWVIGWYVIARHHWGRTRR